METTNQEIDNKDQLEQQKMAAEKRRRTRIWIFNSLSFLVAAAALFWAIVVYFNLDKNVYNEDAQIESYINPINTRIPGYIKEIRFTDHQRVHKGDTLAIIDDREYRIIVKQAEATLLDAKANRNVTVSSEDVAQNAISISEANIQETQARLQNAETNYRRYNNLLKEDVATQYQVDQFKADLDATKAKYDALVKQKRAASLTTIETGTRTHVADAGVMKAGAALDYARLNLSYTIITAPYDGVVGRKVIEEDQFVQPGQTLVTIVRGNEKWVNANFTESQLASLHVGSNIKITVDAVPGKIFHGRIIALSEATGSRYSAIPVDNSTGNFVKVQQRFPVKIAFTSENKAQDMGLLRTGMNVEVELDK
jgi:membrane fusion protein (multidrug efflux system)